MTPPREIGDLNRWSNAAHAVRYKTSRLARHAGWSEKQLWRHFKACGYGCPKEFLDRLRANRARQAIENGVALKEVVHAFHYSHPSHLHRALKKHLGVTPSGIFAQRKDELPKVERVVPKGLP